MTAKSDEDTRVALAAERTLLAWVRTGLALMGFGFVVARSGLLLGEIGATRGEPSSPDLPLWLGAALILLGVLANLAAAVQHVRLLNSLRPDDPHFSSAWSLGVVVTVALATLGVLMTGYLFVSSP